MNKISPGTGGENCNYLNLGILSFFHRAKKVLVRQIYDADIHRTSEIKDGTREQRSKIYKEGISYKFSKKKSSSVKSYEYDRGAAMPAMKCHSTCYQLFHRPSGLFLISALYLAVIPQETRRIIVARVWVHRDRSIIHRKQSHGNC